MLRIIGLTKRYGDRTVLADVDLEVGAGEVVGLLGPNGAGKSTLVSIVAGLRRADAGTCTVRGIDALGGSRDVRHLVGLAPQDLGVYPTLTVAENLDFFGRLAGLRGRVLAERIAEAADGFALTTLHERSVQQLSGGERRRVHTAVALLHHPPLLMLDEPTAGVDPGTRAGILDVIRRLAEHGTAVLYSTHYLHEVEQLDASVTLLHEGQVVARGWAGDLIARHGGAAIEITFRGPPPSLRLPHRVEATERTLRVFVDNPEVELAAIVGSLDDAAGRIETVEVIRPDLESVFLALTGQRFATAGADRDGGPA
jgi:ABC-2 type transport system ATP-binding protein